MGGDFRLVAYFYTFLEVHPDRDQIWIAYRRLLPETLLVFVLILEDDKAINSSNYSPPI